MEQKIIDYVQAHPILAAIIFPLVLGVLVSFLVEFIKWLVYGNQEYFLDDKQNKTRDKADNIVFRILTVIISLGCAIAVLNVLDGLFTSIWLKFLFVALNTSVPFAFYHLKGKQAIEAIINKLFNKLDKTDL